MAPDQSRPRSRALALANCPSGFCLLLPALFWMSLCTSATCSHANPCSRQFVFPPIFVPVICVPVTSCCRQSMFPPTVLPPICVCANCYILVTCHPPNLCSRQSPPGLPNAYTETSLTGEGVAGWGARGWWCNQQCCRSQTNMQNPTTADLAEGRAVAANVPRVWQCNDKTSLLYTFAFAFGAEPTCTLRHQSTIM